MKLSEILYRLEAKTAARVCVEIVHKAFLDCEILKLAPEQYLHHGEFCTKAKSRHGIKSCEFNKERSIEIASKGRIFSGCCIWGIWEMAIPVIFQGELAAVIYLGYFKTSEKVSLNPPDNSSIYDLPEITDKKKEELRKRGTFIREFMLLEMEKWHEQDGGKKQKNAEYYLNASQNYIARHYSKKLSLSELAEILKVHPNYLSAIIKHKAGKTFSELLTEKRLNEAEILLRFHSELKINEISVRCGFQDSNYFCFVFKKKNGMSPKLFRKAKIIK